MRFISSFFHSFLLSPLFFCLIGSSYNKLASTRWFVKLINRILTLDIKSQRRLFESPDPIADLYPILPGKLLLNHKQANNTIFPPFFTPVISLGAISRWFWQLGHFYITDPETFWEVRCPHQFSLYLGYIDPKHQLPVEEATWYCIVIGTTTLLSDQASKIDKHHMDLYYSAFKMQH